MTVDDDERLSMLEVRKSARVRSVILSNEVQLIARGLSSQRGSTSESTDFSIKISSSSEAELPVI